jgi:hypothetical protein
MNAADWVIRWSTAVAVLSVAAVAAVASYEHAYDLVRAHGEAGWPARLVPLTVDGLIYASSVVMLDSARRDVVRDLVEKPGHTAAASELELEPFDLKLTLGDSRQQRDAG